MRRVFPGLRNTPAPSNLVPEGLYLVRIRQARLCNRGEKPFLQLEFEILEPTESVGDTIRTRLYCTPRALWKLQWFLRDFGYDQQLFSNDEINDKELRDLSAVIKVSHHDVNGRTWVNLDAFAPASTWKQDTPVPGAA